MPKGYADFRFYGGPRNEEVWPDTPLLMAKPRVSIRFRCHAEFDAKRRLISLPIDQDLGPKWFMHMCDIYAKRERTEAATGVEYNFVETREIGRCAALTKAGKHCRNDAAQGSIVCETAHRSEKQNFSLIAEGIVLEELRSIAAANGKPNLNHMHFMAEAIAAHNAHDAASKAKHESCERPDGVNIHRPKTLH